MTTKGLLLIFFLATTPAHADVGELLSHLVPEAWTEPGRQRVKERQNLEVENYLQSNRCLAAIGQLEEYVSHLGGPQEEASGEYYFKIEGNLISNGYAYSEFAEIESIISLSCEQELKDPRFQTCLSQTVALKGETDHVADGIRLKRGLLERFGLERIEWDSSIMPEEPTLSKRIVSIQVDHLREYNYVIECIKNNIGRNAEKAAGPAQ